MKTGGTQWATGGTQTAQELLLPSHVPASEIASESISYLTPSVLTPPGLPILPTTSPLQDS